MYHIVRKRQVKDFNSVYFYLHLICRNHFTIPKKLFFLQIHPISTSTSAPHIFHAQNISNTTETPPEDEKPSMVGHQSEDDGYMSMNGRKQPKFNMGVFRPLTEHHREIVHPGDSEDFPPPPEEAQRLIATLLPK